MAIFPQRYFTQEQVAIRTGPLGLRAPYKAASLNQAFCGRPKGAYRGFTPSALGGVLTLAVGPEGYSIAKVDSFGDKGGLDVRVDAPVVLDFSTANPGDFLPDGVQVILRAVYVDGVETTAQIITRSTTPTETVFTVGGVAAALDLSTLAPLDSIVPGTLSIQADIDGIGVFSITDDWAGNLAGAPLSGAGSVNYEAGTLVGVTLPLTALSAVVATYTRFVRRDEALLCVVTGTPAAIVVNAAAPAERDEPIAYPTVPFGFMPAGSVEQLEAAVEILSEVEAARVDLQGVVHPSLKARLDTDLGAEALGFRLGRIFCAIRGNNYQVAGGVSEFNVSGSMSSVSRNFLPAVALNGLGSETTTGVVASPEDPERNICLLLDATTGERLIDNTLDRNVVYGRLHQAEDFILDGEISFVNALTAVVGNADTRFTLQLQVGDTLQGPDGNFYQVASITNDAALVITDAYQGSSATSAALIRRRFTITTHRLLAGVESSFPLPALTQVQTFLPAFLTHATATFSAGSFAYKPGERPVVPDASTTLQGKIALASGTSPFVGSLNVQIKGVPLAGGPFHTLNFTGSPGALVELAPGSIDVTNIGPVGPAGPGGGPGAPGPTGPQGVSINQITPFSAAGSETAGGGAPGPIPITHTVTFGYDLLFVSGGFSLHRDAGVALTPNDRLEITDIDITGPQQATITGVLGVAALPCDAIGKLYLDACGTA